MEQHRYMVGAAAAVCLLLTGCAGGDLDAREVTQYLEARYDGTFTQVSAVQVPRGSRQYLDERITETLETREDLNDDDCAEVYVDDAGTTFHVYHVLRYGMFGSVWMVTDDYAVQWLMAQPETYAALMESDHAVSYFNDLGTGEDPSHAGFRLTIGDLGDVRPAVELAYRVIGDDRALLPDRGLSGRLADDVSAPMSITPCIEYVTTDGALLGRSYFRTEQIPQCPDREDLIDLIEERYVAAKEADGPAYAVDREDVPLYIGETKIGDLTAFYSGMYVTEDTVPLGEALELPTLCTICRSCGYTYQATANRIEITRGEDRIVITRKNGKGYDRSIFQIARNGVLFLPEGEIDDCLDTNRCCLTIADYRYLFGIEIALDDTASRAAVQCG